MTTAEQAKQVAAQCKATATSPIAVSIMVDGGSGTLRELLTDCSDYIDALAAENERLREVLKNLLEDTQHAEHEDCEDGPCPVREARAALGEAKS